MTDQYYQPWHQNEPVNTAEKEDQHPEEPIETPQFQAPSEAPQFQTPSEAPQFQTPSEAPQFQAPSEAVKDDGVPEEKPEPWKTSFPAPTGQVSVKAENPDMLLDGEEIQHFRTRWNEVQATFVDEPGASVRQADALVAEVMAQVTQILANKHHTLESQWNKGEVSTEDLRQILQSYRAFFNRLLK
jgi:hypothetical protein